MSNKSNRINLYLKVHKTPFGDEIWICPKNSRQEYFLTDYKISYKEILKWKEPLNTKPTNKEL